MKIRNFTLLLLLSFYLFPSFALAMMPEQEEKQQLNNKKIAVAVRTDDIIEFDGKIDEDVWEKCTPLDGFLQKDPFEGKKSDGDIQIRFLYDDEYLYIGGKFSHKKEIRSTVARRDKAGNSERIIISLDTYDDKRTAYSFGLTASSVRIDYQHQNDNEYSRDYSFNPVWEGKSVILDWGLAGEQVSEWTAEIRIPITQLRFNDKIEQEWGLNINWWIPALKEDAYWVLVLKNETGWSSRMGILKGIKNIKPSSRIELMPYVAGNLIYDPIGDKRNPFYDEYSPIGRVGMDFKMGLSTNFSLDATINPDFGQVEADPAVVNLSAFETFYAEKRPFFVEGKQLLRGYNNSFFYSRRIGQAPRGNVDGDFINSPIHSNILAATKVTGRSVNGLSIGALSAITGKEFGEYYNISDSSKGKSFIGPLTSFSVLRLKQDLVGKEVSSVGLLLTNVYRDMKSGSELASIYNRNAVTGDIDWFFRFDDATYQLEGHAGFSHVAGDNKAIVNLQHTSAHYFQRPDASHVEVDSNATSLTGYTAYTEFKKIAGENWLWEVNAGFETAGLQLNDIGRFHNGDEITTTMKLKYRENVPGELFYFYSIMGYYYNEWDMGGNHLIKNLVFKPKFIFHNRSRLNIDFWYQFAGLSISKTRGGPLMGTYESFGGEVEFSSDWTANNQWEVSIESNRNVLEGWDLQFYGRITLKFFDRFEFSIKPRYTAGVNPRQYVQTIADGSEITYGKRYIFAYIKRQMLSAKFRLNYAFTSDFTLELYIEPFASNGDYYNYGELAKPKTYDLHYYNGDEGMSIVLKDDGKYYVTDNEKTFDFRNPDFQYLSFRSNFVLRWEYIPGSTLYLVWQQNKSDYWQQANDFGINSLMDSYSALGTNTLALKVSYWLPIN